MGKTIPMATTTMTTASPSLAAACVRQTMAVKGSTERLVFQFNGPFASNAAGGISAATLQNNAGPISLYSTGGNGLYVQSGSGNVGIKTTAPASELDVSGTITASALVVPTISVTDLNASGSLTVTGLLTASNVRVLGSYQTVHAFESHSSNLEINNLGTGPALKVTQAEDTAQPVASFYAGANPNPALLITSDAYLAVGKTLAAFAVDVSGTVNADAFIGDGSLISKLNATAITSGTIDNTHLPQTIDITGKVKSDSADVTNRLTAGIANISTQLTAGSAVVSSELSAGSLLVSGLATFNDTLTVTGLLTASNVRILGFYETVNAIETHSSNVIINNLGTGPGLVVTQSEGSPQPVASFIAGNAVALTITSDAFLAVGKETAAFAVDVSGTVNANAFIGDGSLVTNINATAITSGTLDNMHLPQVISISGDFTTAGNATILGTLNCGYLALGGTAIDKDMAIGGSTTLNGQLSANSNAAFNQNVTVAQSLTVTGASAFASALTVTGLLTASNIQILGSFETVNALTTLSSNMIINNHGSGPGLVVTQSGAQAVASFYAGSNTALFITSDAYVAFGKETAAFAVDVSGAVNANAFIGDGSLIINTNASAIATGTLDNRRLPADISVLSFTGDGSALTNLNATAITTGTLDNRRLPADISISNQISALYADISGNLTAATIVSRDQLTANSAVVTNAITAGYLTVSGTTTLKDSLTVTGLLTASNIQILGSFETVNAIETHSSNLIINNLGSGPALVVTQEGLGGDVASFTAGSAPALTITGDAFLAVGKTTAAFAVDVSGTVNANAFIGDGSLIINTNATAIATGTINNARLPTLIYASNIGIGGAPASLFPLDVSGDLNFTGKLYQGGIPYLGSQWTSLTDSNLYFPHEVAIGDVFEPIFTLDVSGSVHITEQSVFGPAGATVDASGALLRVAGDAVVVSTLKVGNITDLSGTNFVRDNATVWYDGAEYVHLLQDDGVALNVGEGGSVGCRYMQLGNLVTAEIAIVFGNAATLGTTDNAWNFTLPIEPGGSFNNNIVGSAFIVNADSANYTAAVVGNAATATNSKAVSIFTNMSTGGIAGADFEWTIGDTINMTLTYESNTRAAIAKPLAPFTVDPSGNVFMAGNLQFFSASHLQSSPFTPVWSASVAAPTLGNGSLTGSYSQTGNFVTADIKLAIGSSTTLGTGSYSFTTPLTATVTKSATAWLTTAGAITPVLASITGNSNSITVKSSTGAFLDSTLAWAADTTLDIEITYEVASFPIVPPLSSALLQSSASSIGVGKSPSSSLPASSLDVAGSIVAGGNISTLTGTVSALEVFSTSDRRLKSNIEPLADSLNTIQQLTGVSFTYNANSQDSIGLVAQDVQAVLPQLVREGDNGFLTVNYGALVGLLIEGIKDISSRLTTLEASV